MLQNIGDVLKTKRWLGYLLLGVLGLVFAAWIPTGVVDMTIGGQAWAAKVNGEEISSTEVSDLWARQQPQLLQMFGGEMTETQRVEYQQRLLDSAIRSRVANQRARDLGLQLTDAQLVRAIQQDPNFQVEGKFDAQAYRSRLASVGLTEPLYEADLRDDLLSGQFANALGSTDFLTRQEMLRLMALQDEQREVQFWLFQPEDYLSGPAFSPAAIEAHYKANPATYTSTEAVKLGYAELVLADVANTVEVTDEALRERYEAGKSGFIEPERRKSRHILIPVADAAADAKAKTEVDALHKRIVAGEDFAALAKQFSKDTVSAAEGGDLGWAARDAYVQPFADALFALKEGETSAPVKSEFGYHIIRLEGIRSGVTRSFDDMRAELSAQLRNELAAEAFGNRQEELQARVEGGSTNLAQLAQEFGLRSSQVDRFERGAGGLPLGSDAELNREVFADAVLNQRRVAGPIPLGEDRMVLVQVQEHFKPAVQPLVQVQASVIEALQNQRGAEAATQAAASALARLRKGESFVDVSKGAPFKPEAPRFVGRDANDLPALIRDAVFALPKLRDGAAQVQQVALESGGAAVFRVSAVRSAPVIDNPQILQLRAQRDVQRYGLRDVGAYLTEAVKASKVQKNPQAFLQ